MGQTSVQNLLFVELFYSLAFTIFESGFALFSMRKLSLNVTNTSFILTYVGILVAFTQGFLIRPVSKRFSETNILKLALPSELVLLSIYSFSSQLSILLLILSPLSIVSALSSVSIASMVSKSVPREKVGGTLGIFNSVDGLTRIVSPILSGLIIQNLGPSFKGPIEGAFLFVSLLMFFRYFSQ
ncbi:MFS transporter [Fervidobacterium thailandense]|uniref:MFS transporter n=1 Tax=Fervidobacterium thailandense TaxID=1008305 RepID=UPI003B97F68B